jgi:hypothetical protein
MSESTWYSGEVSQDDESKSNDHNRTDPFQWFASFVVNATVFFTESSLDDPFDVVR